MRSDNGPRYDSAEVSHFAKEWGFKHVTSSPRFPQSNGEVERGVQTVKNLLQKAEDPDDDDDDLYFALFTLNLHYICRSKL